MKGQGNLCVCTSRDCVRQVLLQGAGETDFFYALLLCAVAPELFVS